MVAVPDMLRMAAKGPSAEDPRGMEQRYVLKALFNTRGGLLGGKLDGVDRELLFAAVRSGVRNEDGHARGAISAIYSSLTYDELKPILPIIRQAIIDRSPSGEMFDGQIQFAGLDLFSKHHVSEGIGLLADYVVSQKKHGSENTTPKVLEMLKRYGAHAQRAIPQLEKAIHYFENEETDFPKAGSLKKAEAVRQAIAEIKARTDKPTLKELEIR